MPNISTEFEQDAYFPFSKLCFGNAVSFGNPNNMPHTFFDSVTLTVGTSHKEKTDVSIPIKPISKYSALLLKGGLVKESCFYSLQKSCWIKTSKVNFSFFIVTLEISRCDWIIKWVVACHEVIAPLWRFFPLFQGQKFEKRGNLAPLKT